MLTELVQHCRIVFADNQALLWTLFSGGLIGSMTHCTGMCGPFVMSQTAARLSSQKIAQLTEWSRMRGAALLPYHLGRMTTYCFLGVLAAAMTAYFRRAPWFHYVAAALLVVAGLIFLAQAVHFLRIALPRFLPVISVPVPGAVKTLLQKLLIAPQGWRGYALGVMLGFLPCGLVYAALAAVAAHADPLLAIPAMIGFSLGTIPVLILAGFGGQFLMGRWRWITVYATPILMFINSWALFAMAGGIIR